MICAAYCRPPSRPSDEWASELRLLRLNVGGHSQVMIARAGTRFDSEFVDDSVAIVAVGVRADAVAAGYHAHGLACARKIRGRFAFILYDIRRRRLIGTSALTGRQPLAYWSDAHTTVMGTRMLPLLRYAGAPRGLDEVYLAHLVFGLEAMEPGSTPVQGVRRLLAGQALLVDDDGPRVVVADGLTPRPCSGAPALRAQTFWTVVERVVRDQLAGVRRPCLSLSGGLDSLAIGVAWLRGDHQADALAMVSPRLAPSEEAAIRDAARSLTGMNVRLTDVTGAVDLDLDSLPLRDDPHLVPLCFFPARRLLWSEASRAGFDSMLDGEGGDELFEALVSPLDALRRGRWWTLVRHLWAHPARRAIVRRSLVLPIVASRARPGATQPDGLLLPAFASWHAAAAPATRAALDQRRQRETRGTQESLVRGWLSEPAIVGASVSHAQVAAHHGIELASPLLDRNVVELVLGLPPQDLLSRGAEKQFLRSALVGLVPEGLRTAPKSERLADELLRRIVSSDRTRELLRDERVRARLVDMVRFEKLEAMVDAAAAGRIPARALWYLECIVSFASWYARASREFGID